MMRERTDFFQVGGTLSEDAPSYIERPADKELLAALERGELCLVLAPRQTGKSSLMVHAVVRLREDEVRGGIVDLQLLGSQKDPDRWFGAVVNQIGRSLKLKVNSIEWWKAHNQLDATQRFTNFLEDVVLAEVQGEVVLFFDEIDSVLSLPFSDDFFTTIRSVYNARASNPTLRRLIFVLLGVATASSFIKDRTRTPFNIGRSIALDDFDEESIEPFRKALGPDCDPLIDRIFYWTNGQPYLVQRLAATAYSWPPEEYRPERIDEEVKRSYLQRKIEQDAHLKFIQDYLLDDSISVRKTLRTYRQILYGKAVSEDERSLLQSRLKLAGVVRGEDKKLVTRNRVYERIFDFQWVREHTPRDIQKLVAYGASSALALLLLWILSMFVIQPLLFPKFTNRIEIIKYTSEPSVEVQLQVEDVSQAFLDGKEVLVPQNGLIRGRIGSLQTGESTHQFKLVGGLFSKTHEIPVRVTYYPGWQIRQFPDPKLKEIGHSKGVVDVAFSSNGKWVVSGSKDTTLKLWDVRTGEVLQTFSDHTSEIWSVAFSPDDKTVISGSGDNTLKLWDVGTGEVLHTFSGHAFSLFGRGSVFDVTFSPDGKRMVSQGVDTKLWDVERREELHTFSDHPYGGIAFSPDGKTVASGSTDRTVKLWDVDTGEVSQSILGHADVVVSVAFSPDGKTVASGSADRTVKLWDVHTGEVSQSILGHTGSVDSIAFSPDSKTVASGSTDGMLKLWDVDTGHVLRMFSGHTGDVHGVAFSPDGQRVISGSSDGTLKLWWAAIESKYVWVEDEFSQVSEVLEQWREGYENKDIEMYISVFWEKGFLYTSDMGTDDTTDDLVFNDLQTEKESAMGVFARFQDIEIGIHIPSTIELNQTRDRAEVKIHYRVQGFVLSGEHLEGGYIGWFGEGDALFIFELRAGEWRITEWHDEEFSEEDIRAAMDRAGKLPAEYMRIKNQR